MKITIYKCDIEDMETHTKAINEMELEVIFDHDQEDGKSKRKPYLDNVKIDICSTCREYMFAEKRYIYAYGAMGHNKYYLK